LAEREGSQLITGIHGLIFASDADGVRGFFRDVLGFPSVDTGDGWLIFRLPPAELGVHPDGEGGRHQLSLLCDDVQATVAELRAKGVEFTRPIRDEGWGLETWIRLPGGGELSLYQPKHPSPLGS
jgi:catechol 2,3-dioxygenase-like lactoylglutathione lyase family enzyme